MREFLIAVAAATVVTGVAVSAGLLAFLGTVVDPIFTDLAVILLVGSVAAGLWVWRSERRAQEAAQACADTEVLDIEAIANHQPGPPPSHPITAGWWRRARRRTRRVKEGAR